VISTRIRLTASVALTTVAALTLAAASPAHQVASLSGGQLKISGDLRHKPNDLITLDYDSSRDEVVIGNDIFGGHPRRCRPDAAHPQRIFHCPASLISSVQIEAGHGSDRVIAKLPASIPLQARMSAGNDAFEGGPEIDTVRGGSGSDKLYGRGGDDTLFGGGAADKLFGGGGNDTCVPGPGRGKLSSC
jgi:hypothetical protein